ncbi:unnamed protein product, partial [Larinioides sclopetarius]
MRPLRRFDHRFHLEKQKFFTKKDGGILYSEHTGTFFVALSEKESVSTHLFPSTRNGEHTIEFFISEKRRTKR